MIASMSKKIVLQEAEYLEMSYQAAYWKSRFGMRRERDRKVETRLKNAETENEQHEQQLAAQRQVIAAPHRKIVEQAEQIEGLKAQLEKQVEMISGSRSEKKKGGVGERI